MKTTKEISLALFTCHVSGLYFHQVVANWLNPPQLDHLPAYSVVSIFERKREINNIDNRFSSREQLQALKDDGKLQDHTYLNIADRMIFTSKTVFKVFIQFTLLVNAYGKLKIAAK